MGTRWPSTPGAGRELWKTQIADVGSGETVTMAPLVVKDRVIVGASGGEFGIYGWMKGLDLKTGQRRVDRPQPRTRCRHAGAVRRLSSPLTTAARTWARSSWANDGWRTGGAPVWGWLSYDPELDLIYYGTGNAGPYNAEQRPGDNKWTASVLARRPEDGTLVWAYQFTPHDSWDFDATGAMVLADLTVAGKPVKALVHFDKNGFAYTLDRATGRLLVAAAVRGGELGEVGGSYERPPGGRPGQGDRRLEGQREGHLPLPRGWRESRIAAGLLAAHASLLYLDQQPVHGLRRAPRASYLKGTPFMGVNSPYCARPRRLSRLLHRVGCGAAAARCGRTRRRFPTGAARS